MRMLAIALLIAGVSACGDASVVRRGVSTPPPSDAQLSPQDAVVQWGERDRNNNRGSY